MKGTSPLRAAVTEMQPVDFTEKYKGLRAKESDLGPLGAGCGFGGIIDRKPVIHLALRVKEDAMVSEARKTEATPRSDLINKPMQKCNQKTHPFDEWPTQQKVHYALQRIT